MKAPKCKLCGKFHYGLCIPVAEDTLNTADSNRNVVYENKLRDENKALRERIAVLETDQESRRKYMREYMQRYRSVEKQK